MDTQRLKQIDRVLNEGVTSGEVAGCQALVIKDGQEQYFGQSGWADKESGRPMTRDTIFRLFSMSKPVTAAAAMILVERGVIDLLDPVSKYLPGFLNQSVCTDAGLVKLDVPLCLKDLLGMTAGTPYPGTDSTAAVMMDALWAKVQENQLKGDELGTVAFANEMGKIPLAFKPNTKWQYGVCADIMGAVIEVASGKRFGDFMREEIFEPLNMKDTGYYVPAEKRNRFVTTYQPSPDGLKPYLEAHLCMLPMYDHEPAYQAGGAGLVSTIDDYARFAQMLCNGGELDGKRILSARTIRFMTQSQLTDDVQKTITWDSLRGYGYANFMRIAQHEGQGMTPMSEGEYGWDGWQGTYFAISPKDQMILLFMIQKIDTGTIDLTRKFRSIAYASL